ncbi:MAG: outer membrane lipoprotein-sorting protein, partial [Firmicutes bacterium]|nr:outer membrane lipoprotein-sorting protein [Bacillota bacterium]
MKRKLIFLVVCFTLFSIFATMALGALTAEEIIKRRDDNEHFETAQVEA